VGEARPRLELVPPGGERRPASAETAGRPARPGRRLSPWLLALLGVALALSLREARLLGVRVEALAAELAATRAELLATRGAYQGHLAGAREALLPLEADLAALREHLERDPLAAPPPAPEPEAPPAP